MEQKSSKLAEFDWKTGQTKSPSFSEYFLPYGQTVSASLAALECAMLLPNLVQLALDCLQGEIAKFVKRQNYKYVVNADDHASEHSLDLGSGKRRCHRTLHVAVKPLISASFGTGLSFRDVVVLRISPLIADLILAPGNRVDPHWTSVQEARSRLTQVMIQASGLDEKLADKLRPN